MIDYTSEILKQKESQYLISMTSVDELIRLGVEMGLNSNTQVLDLCCGYGQVLKIWSEAFGIRGVGVDICQDYIEVGQTRVNPSLVTLIHADVLEYQEDTTYDVVICSETIESIEKTLRLGQSFLKDDGILCYQRVFLKKENPPQALIEFEGELLTLYELHQTFHSLGFFMTHFATDSDAQWERYVTWSARRDFRRLKQEPENAPLGEWIDKWYKMYLDYRRIYEGQGFFCLVKGTPSI